MNLTLLRRYKYLIIILAVAIIARILWLKLTLNADEGELGYDAMTWLRGELPYTTRLSEKPPLAYLIYLVPEFFFGNTIIPVRILNDVLFFISIIALYLVVKNWYGKSVGLVSSFLYVFLLDAPVSWGAYAVAIHLSMPFTIFSVLACNRYVETKNIAFLFVSGTFLSIAGLIRLNSFVTVLVLLIILILSKWKSPTKSTKRFLDSLYGNLSVLAAGILFPLAAVLIYFWTVGVLDKMIYNVLTRVILGVTPEVSTLGAPSSWQFLGLIEWLPIVVFMILGVIACILMRRRQDTYVLGWLLAPLLSFLVEPHDYYHLAVLAPAASILSALALYPSLNAFRQIKNNFHVPQIHSRDIQSAFIVTIFILSLLPSIFFQALQYPSGNVQWSFIDREYSTIGNYDQIIQLASYLKSLNVKDGEVLAQDWVPYVYWLTGIKAPSIHLNTYQIGPGIPLEDYEKLLTEVRGRQIPYVVVISNRPEGVDNITDFVRDNYFLVNSIGGADVYGASYTVEKDVYYSFIANLQEAQKYALLPGNEEKPLEELNISVIVPKLEKLAISGEVQYAIFQHPVFLYSNITYSNVQILANATLEFSIGINPSVWTLSGDGVLFEIIAENEGQSNKIFSKYIDPKHNEAEREWLYYRIPLQGYGNRTINLSLITDPGPVGDSNNDWAYWGNPLIRQGN